MRLTVKCGHGVETTLEDVPDLSDAYIRSFIRNVLLACPACRHQAEAELEEPGA